MENNKARFQSVDECTKRCAAGTMTEEYSEHKEFDKTEVRNPIRSKYDSSVKLLCCCPGTIDRTIEKNKKGAGAIFRGTGRFKTCGGDRLCTFLTHQFSSGIYETGKSSPCRLPKLDDPFFLFKNLRNYSFLITYPPSKQFSYVLCHHVLLEITKKSTHSWPRFFIEG